MAGREGLWTAERRALTIGLILTITFVAAEALAVATVMPLVARDLRGLNLYGFVFSAFMLGTLVGIVAAGRAADRNGPALPYIAGLVIFAAGLLVSGLATSMPMLVGGRALQGIGAGAVPAVAYTAIGRSLPEHLRASMMAMMSTAWVAPGLIGPAISAEVAHLFGWRWVFLGLIPFIAVTGPFAIPALVRLGRPETRARDGHRLADGVGLAITAGLVLTGLTLLAGSGSSGGSGAQSAAATGGLTATLLTGPAAVISGAVMIAVGGVGVVIVLRRLLPEGTLTARSGLPATVLVRGLVTFGFYGADAFVTLTVTILRQHSALVAGVAVTCNTVAWAAGSWIQARLHARWTERRLIRVGVIILLAGTAGLAVMLSDRVPVAEGIAAWTVAGLGMGMCYGPITLLMLKRAPAGREGWASASLNVADVLGSAMGIGVGGAMISAAVSFGGSLAVGLAIAFGCAAAASGLALAVSRRLPVTDGGPAAQPDVSELTAA